VKLPKMESDRVGGPCIEHAANTKPNLPCFKHPSLTEEFIRIEHGCYAYPLELGEPVTLKSVSACRPISHLVPTVTNTSPTPASCLHM
jgi:hypothetical protein